MISRRSVVYHGTEIIKETFIDIEWESLREARNRTLSTSDWRASSDRELSDDWINYRAFLRDLPQNFPGDNANDACDAWDDYDKPEGA